MSDGSYSLPPNLVERPEAFPGFPELDESNLLSHFKEPPPGYGGIPFFWWTGGDTLTKERLLWQLDKLGETAIQGLNVSYNHTHRIADPKLNMVNDRISFGVPEPSFPGFATDEWWSLWNWFSEECGKREMGLGLDDYVVGWPGGGSWTDRVDDQLRRQNYPGNLRLHHTLSTNIDSDIEIRVPENIVSIVAYPMTGKDYNFKEGIDLLPAVRNSVLKWKAPDNRTWDVIMISSENGYMLHPDHGNLLVKEYFQDFENRMSPAGKKGMNFFFQDELHLPIGHTIWSEDFARIFKARKEYNIQPYLPALFYNIGNISPKVRLDYYDVMLELFEQRYFKPVFEWHWKRGKLFGCDNMGRGLQPASYGDYFRATRWFSAPGNDAPNPANGYSFIQTKVSSSVAHLYKRPRVWLEAFHSLGWNASLSEIDFSTYKHFQFGANLLCLHGLYYTTHGGWWEWAPPDFHFRMPYWPHLKEWLRSTERLSYICSQGVHVCDIAILYPVAPLQAGTGASPELAFQTGEILFNRGLDFDFIDFQSLNRSEIKKGTISVSDENYRVLVLADMTAIRFASLQKALDHFNRGGVVVGVGQLPVASDRDGAGDPEIDRMLKKIFAVTASEASQLKSPSLNRGGGIGLYFPSVDEKLVEMISEHMERDFDSGESMGSVMHRRIGDHDLYMVMDVPKNTQCYFRATGIPYLLNSESGDYRELKIVRNTESGTYLRLPLGRDESNLIIFTPGKAEQESENSGTREFDEKVISGIWESEFVPTMDNRWGDFRLPATDDTIGVEARFFMYKMSDFQDRKLVSEDFHLNWDTAWYSFGPGFWYIHTDKKEIIKGNKALSWKAYSYSLRQGVRGNPGSQGYHGLKGKVSDDFLILGEGGTYYFKTYVNADRKKEVDIHISGQAPAGVFVNGEASDGKSVTLKKGSNCLMVHYAEILPGTFSAGPHPIDQRTRSAVVLMDKGSVLKERKALSMLWFGQEGVNTFDIYKGEQKFGYYRFQSPPGLSRIECKAFGEIHAFMNGLDLRIENKGKKDAEGCNSYTIYLDQRNQENSEICLEVEHQAGYYGGRAFPEPLKLICGKGSIRSGDWSKLGNLLCYSGGLWYRKHIEFEKHEISGNVYIDLGEVAASAELYLNGKKAGICMKKPFRLDITDLVREGDNYFEILVYSSLANHYFTIPTPMEYKKSFSAGLIGPVKIISERENLTATEQ